MKITVTPEVVIPATVTLEVSPEVAALLLVLTCQASGSPDNSLRKYADEFSNGFYDQFKIHGYDITDDAYEELTEKIEVPLGHADLKQPFFRKIVDKIKGSTR